MRRDKEYRTTLSEFVTKISDDELKYVGVRLVERMAGDIPNVLQYLETRGPVHEILSTAGSGEELFSLLGLLQEAIQKEAQRRKIILSIRPLLSNQTTSNV